MKVERSYTQRARARSVEETRRRIVESFFTLAESKLFTEIPLTEIAAAAGVTVQTVLRQFGSRAGLFEKTFEYGAAVIAAERQPASGDPARALTALVDHYELRGVMVLMMLAQESTDPMLARVVRGGRDVHRSWVETAFADVGPSAEDIDLLVVATDVYTWKLLRLDRGLTRAQTQSRMQVLIDRILRARGE